MAEISAARTDSGNYRFERFCLSEDGTLLVRDGAVVPLAPKVLQTLLALVRRAGKVVKKEEILSAVWPDSIVEDTGLTRNVSLLRQALGDDGQRLIVTVARVGYRFAGSVQRGEEVTDPGGGRLPRLPIDRPQGDREPLFVGRADELNRLRVAFGRARTGHGTLLALTGEPGIGKTTVAEAFLNGVKDVCHIGRGRCSERLAGAEPHLPLLEALDEVTAARPDFVDTLRRVAPTWSEYVAPQAQASRRDPGTAEPATTRGADRLMRELTLFLEEASRQQPLVIFIDDLHWADVATVDVLAHLAPRLARMRLLLLVTYRQREMLLTQHPFGRLRSDLIGRAQLDEVQVTLLGRDDVREYVQCAFGGGPAPAELAALVFERSEGNPLFMAELVWYLRQKGISERDALAARDVPDSLRGLMERGLQELTAVTRHLLSIAAVQGYEFDSATLAEVSGTPAADVEEHLRTAQVVHALVKLDHEDELPDGKPSLVYRFVHVLFQNALVDSIARSRRVGWARQIAEALVRSHAERADGIAGRLAVLFETGRDFWTASHFFLVASRNAARLFAFATAEGLAARGLQSLKSVRGLDACEVARRELDLTFARLVPVATIQGYGTPEVERLTRRVVALAEKLGDVAATASALSATWIVGMARGECVAARQAGTRLAALAIAAHDDVLLMNAHMQAQIASHHLGKFREAREHAAAVMRLADRVSHVDRCMTVFDPVVASLAESSRNWWITGYLARAVTDCEAAVTLGRQLRHPDSLAFAWLFHGWLHGYRGDWTTCVESTDKGISIARDSRSVQTLAWNQCVHGWAVAHIGNIAAGEAELAAGMNASNAIMGQVALPQFSLMMAEVMLLRDDLASAETWLQSAARVQHSNDDRYFAAEVHRLSAVCLSRRGQHEISRCRLHEAIAVARSQDASTFELRAALCLMEHDLQEGRLALRSALDRVPEPQPWPEVATAHRVLA